MRDETTKKSKIETKFRIIWTIQNEVAPVKTKETAASSSSSNSSFGSSQVFGKATSKTGESLPKNPGKSDAIQVGENIISSKSE